MVISLSTFAQDDDRRFNKLEKAYLKDKITSDEYDQRLGEACTEGCGICCLRLAYRKKSIAYYYKAAKLGNYEGRYNAICEWLFGGRNNYDSALAYARELTPGASQASPSALYSLYLKGSTEIKADPRIAKAMAAVAATKDPSDGALYVARCWADSVDNWGDPDSAVAWYQRATTAGDYRARAELAAYLKRQPIIYFFGTREYKAAHPDHQRLSAEDFGPTAEDARRQAEWERAHPLPQQQAAYKSTQPTIDLVKHKSQDDINRENDDKARREQDQREKSYNDKWHNGR